MHSSQLFWRKFIGLYNSFYDSWTNLWNFQMRSLNKRAFVYFIVNSEMLLHKDKTKWALCILSFSSLSLLTPILHSRFVCKPADIFLEYQPDDVLSDLQIDSTFLTLLSTASYTFYFYKGPYSTCFFYLLSVQAYSLQTVTLTLLLR